MLVTGYIHNMKITKDTITKVFHAGKSSIETMQYKGYELIEELFVDSSGLGGPNEPADTTSQFIKKLENILIDNPSVTAKITNAGQFQVYIGLFKKTGPSRCTKIANNTFRIEIDGGYIIRLHDTDILTVKGQLLTLDSGGYQTMTTKARLNEYLPGGYQVNQKDYIWTVTTPAETLDFVDGMAVNYV